MCDQRIGYRWILIFVILVYLYGSCESQYSFQVELVQRNWSYLSDAELDKVYRESVDLYEDSSGSGTEPPSTVEPSTQDPTTSETTVYTTTVPESTTNETTLVTTTVPESTTNETTLVTTTVPESTTNETTLVTTTAPESTTSETTLDTTTVPESTTSTDTTAEPTTTTAATSTTIPTCPVSCEGCSGPCEHSGTDCVCPCIGGFEPVIDGCELIYCEMETLNYTDGTTNKTTEVKFPRTAAGYSTSSDSTCPPGTSNAGLPYGTRMCQLDATWGEPTWLSTCDVNLNDLTTVEIKDEGQRLEIANDLEVVSSEPENLQPENVTDIVNALDNVVNTPDPLPANTSSSVINTVGNLLSAPTESLQDSDQTEQLLTTLDTVGEKVELDETGQYQEVTSTLAMAVVEPTTAGLRSSVGVGYGVLDLSTLQELGFRSDQLTTFDDGSTENFSAYINIPQALLSGDNQRVSFYALIDDALFPSAGSNGWTYNSSVVLSASLPNATSTKDLNPPVEMKFALQAQGTQTYSELNTSCGFWDGLDWSTEGASVTEVMNNTITCEFSHLTNFAALFNPNFNDSRALDLITIIGCSISLFALLATILWFTFDKKTRTQGKGRTSFLMVNLAVSLLLLNVSMLLSEMDFVYLSPDACLSIAVFIHFFMFSSLAWMLVEGVMFFITIAFPFYMNRGMKNRNLFAISTVCAWLLPAIFVSVVVGVDAETYRNGDICWITESGIIYFVVIPFSIIIGLNLALYIAVMFLYFRQRRRHRPAAARGQDRGLADLLLSLALFVAMGGTWIFAIVLLSGTSDTLATVFAYIFAILNSLQGLFLFLLFVVRHKVGPNKKQPQQSTRSDMGATRSGANYTIPSTEVSDWMSLAVQIPRPSLKDRDRAANR